MKITALSITMFFIAVCFASARLGEIFQEINERYGAAIEKYDLEGRGSLYLPATEAYIYSKPKVLIVVHFWNGKSCIEHYVKHPPEMRDSFLNLIKKQIPLDRAPEVLSSWTKHPSGAILSIDKMKILLELNSGGSSWPSLPDTIEIVVSKSVSLELQPIYRNHRNDGAASYVFGFSDSGMWFYICSQDYAIAVFEADQKRIKDNERNEALLREEDQQRRRKEASEEAKSICKGFSFPKCQCPNQTANNSAAGF